MAQFGLMNLVPKKEVPHGWGLSMLLSQLVNTEEKSVLNLNIGIMVGFVFAAIIANYFTGILTWRFAFQVQAVGEVPIALFFFFQDNKKIDVLADQKESSAAVLL